MPSKHPLPHALSLKMEEGRRNASAAAPRPGVASSSSWVLSLDVPRQEPGATPKQLSELRLAPGWQDPTDGSLVNVGS